LGGILYNVDANCQPKHVRLSKPLVTATDTPPSIIKKYRQDIPGDRLKNVVDRSDNHSEEREKKPVMGVRSEGVTDSRSAVRRTSR
jgi:hypothetical protein